VTREQIICKTTPYKNFTYTSENLPLKVTVGSSSATPSTGRNFYYAIFNTPVIKNIYPSTTFDSGKIKMWGIHGILKIGDGR
jgi:hypothetical protein